MSKIILTPPLQRSDLAKLKAGDTVYISGTIYTARDAAHKRLVELTNKGEKLPLNLQGQIIYLSLIHICRLFEPSCGWYHRAQPSP